LVTLQKVKNAKKSERLEKKKINVKEGAKKKGVLLVSKGCGKKNRAQNSIPWEKLQ